MGRFHMVRWTVAGLLLLAGLLVSGAGAQAQDGLGPVPFTIHKSACPIDFSGSLADACYDRVVEGVEFEIAGPDTEPATAITDADGLAVSEISGSPATISVTESAASYDDYLGAYVVCTDETTGIVLFDGPADEDGVVSFGPLAAGQAVACDWYNFTEIENDLEGTLMLTLPATGSGSTFHVDLIAAAALVGVAGLVLLLVAVQLRRGDVIVRW